MQDIVKEKHELLDKIIAFLEAKKAELKGDEDAATVLTDIIKELDETRKLALRLNDIKI